MDSNGASALLNVPVVSVALGLMFAYLMASLVASAVKEILAGIFEWRGTYLQRGIGVLLSHEPDAAFGWGWNWLAAHLTWMDLTRKSGAVIALAARATEASRKAIDAAKAQPAPAAGASAQVIAAANTARAAAQAAEAALNALRPSAISPSAVSKDVAEAVRGAIAATRAAADSAAAMAAGPIGVAETQLAAATAAVRVQQVQTHPLVKGTPSRLPSYVPSRDFATAMLDLLRDGSASPVFSQVERTVSLLPDGDIKRILAAFVRDAAGDLDKLRARIETWFDDAMDRLSGIYKRFAQCFLLGLGILIAVTLNIDSVHLAIALYRQPTLRAEIVSAMQSKQQAGAPGDTAPGRTAAPGQAAPSDPFAELQKAVLQIQDTALPIGRSPCASFFGEPDSVGAAAPSAAAGRSTGAASAQAAVCPSRPKYHGYAHWAYWTVFGWLITGFAISLGAPFWFGLLQNIMSLRAAGAPPARADAAKPARAGA